MQSLKNVNFFEKNDVKLYEKFIHQLNSLSDSFIPPKKVIETFHNQGSVIRLKKERKGEKTENLHQNGVPAKH